MLTKISAQVHLCIKRAEYCERLAKGMTLEQNRNDMIQCAKYWRQLAYSYHFPRIKRKPKI